MTAAARPLRADAARNRERILVAARVVFADLGLAASLEDVARHAGLGIGTVYRRFPDRRSLIEALFEDRIHRQVDILKDAVAAEDPWGALVQMLEGTCEELATDRGLRQLMLSTQHGVGRIAAGRDQLHPLAARLVSRAQQSGHLRPEFSAADIPLLFLMISTVSDFAGDASPTLWRRYFTVFIEGISTHPQGLARIPAPLDHNGLVSAMSGWRPSRR